MEEYYPTMCGEFCFVHVLAMMDYVNGTSCGNVVNLKFLVNHVVNLLKFLVNHW